MKEKQKAPLEVVVGNLVYYMRLRDSLDELVSGSIPEFEHSSLNSALIHHTMAPRAAFGTIKSICKLDLGHVKLLALKPDPRTKILPSNFL